MYVTLILFGIVIIITSIYLINNITDKESNIHNDIIKKHDEIIEYSNMLNDIVSNLDNLLDNTIDKMEKNNNIDKIEKNKNNNIGTLREDYNTDRLKTKENNDYDESFPSDNIKKIENISIVNDNLENDIDDNNIEKLVYNFHKQGLSSQEIAKTLKKGIREIEIIIKLLNRDK